MSKDIDKTYQSEAEALWYMIQLQALGWEFV